MIKAFSAPFVTQMARSHPVRDRPIFYHIVRKRVLPLEVLD
jgi:hypothetical protein